MVHSIAVVERERSGHLVVLRVRLGLIYLAAKTELMVWVHSEVVVGEEEEVEEAKTEEEEEEGRVAEVVNLLEVAG